MMTIRRLNPIADITLFNQSYSWLEQSPRWRRETEAVFGTLDYHEYIAALANPERCDIGIFECDTFTALVTLTLRAPAIYEVHFEARRGASPRAVVQAGWEIRDQMFDYYDMQVAFTWTPHWNRRVLAINKAIGFSPDNVSMFRGVARNQPIEWVRYSLSKERNGR